VASLSLFSISDDQLLVKTGLTSFLRFDFSRGSHDLAVYEATKLEAQWKVAQAKLAKMKSLADKYKDRTVTGFFHRGRGTKCFLHGSGESQELGEVFLCEDIVWDLESIADDLDVYLDDVGVNIGVEYDADHDNFKATWAEVDMTSLQTSNL